MTTDSFFALTCASTIALFFGFTLAFAGYRFFLFLLPIWGFFWGFGLGAQSIQALFGNSFLSDVTSWVVGFFLGLLFAVLSYLFFAAAVILAAGSLGYSLGLGLMLALGFDMGLLAWLVGIALAVVVVIVTFVLDLYKWIIILATSIAGAGVIVGTFLFLFGELPTAEFIQNPVRAALNDSPLWWLVGLAVAVAGFVVQTATTRNWTIRAYNRWDEVYTEEPETIVDSSAAPVTAGGLTAATAGASSSGGMVSASPMEPPPPTTMSSTPPATSPPPMEPPPPRDTTGEPPTSTGGNP